MKTRLTEMLNIELPIMLAGMGGVSYSDLVAAVSDAGKEFLANGTFGDIGLLFAAVTAGIGLILAKDSNK
jgi:NAD(P)H-dependent flavin oxidoreductase YrpB (nitropropane dioxygenase family)